MADRGFGVGEFSRPRGVTGISPTHDSTAGAIGAALGGVADILDVGLKASAQARSDRVTGAVETALAEQSKQFQEQGKPVVPDLVGEAAMKSGDPENYGYSPDQVYKMEGLRQGNKQGKISRGEFYAKTSAIVQQAIHDNPRFADAIRKRAQDVLGVSPTAAGIALEMEGQKFAEELQQQQTTFILGEGAKRGISFRNTEDGSVDVVRTVAAVQQALVTENYLSNLNETYDAHIKWATLQAKLNGGEELTEFQRRDIKIQSFMRGDGTAGAKGSDYQFHANVDSFFSTIPDIIAKNPGVTDSVKQTEVMMGELLTIKSSYMGWMNSMLNQVQMPPDDKEKIRQNYLSQFKMYEDSLTGGFSAAQRRATTLKHFATNAEIGGWERAPQMMDLRTQLGDPLFTALSTMALNTADGAGTKLAIDGTFRDGIARMVQMGKVVSGDATIDNARTPEERKLNARAAQAATETLARQLVNKTSADEATDATHLTNAASTMAQTLANSDSIDNLRGGLRTTTSTEVIQALGMLNPDMAAPIGSNFMVANAKAVSLTAGSVMRDMAKLSPANTKMMDTVGRGLLQGDTGIAQPEGRFENGDWQVQYNAKTGLVEAVQGKNSTQERGDLFKPSLRVPPTMQAKIVDINKALNANVALAPTYGNDESKAMRPEDLKMEMIGKTGLPVVGGKAKRPAVAGLVEHGNLEILDRKEVANADGTVSTTRSFSMQDDDGLEVLVPQVIDGVVMSQDAAWKHYKMTGEHFGKFRTPEDADIYANSMHSVQAEHAKALHAERERKKKEKGAKQIKVVD